MTQEDKKLLLQDLCARLPYSVKVKHLLDTYPSDLLCIDAEKNVVYVNHYGREGKYKIECIRPYLRPLSSMTEEEKYQYEKTQWEYQAEYCAPEYFDGLDSYDWLNAHHFDYRGLIPKGLALEAKEWMYNN